MKIKSLRKANEQEDLAILQQQLVDLRKELDQEIQYTQKRIQNLRIKFEEAKKYSLLKRVYRRIISM